MAATYSGYNGTVTIGGSTFPVESIDVVPDDLDLTDFGGLERLPSVPAETVLRIRMPDGGTFDANVRGVPVYTAPPEPATYKHPDPVPGADLFAAKAGAGETPPGVWADWLEERNLSPWFAYALRWMGARDRRPFPLSGGRASWILDIDRGALRPALPAPVFRAVLALKGVDVNDHFECQSFVDAVAALSLALKSLHDALTWEEM